MATDLERKTKAIGGIAENFGKEFSADLLKIWLRLLRPYPPELVEAAAVRVIETYVYKTMPPYAVLREALEEVAGRGPKSAELKAAAEWARLWEEISRRGSYAPPEDMHPTTAHVVGVMGGWRAVQRRHMVLARRRAGRGRRILSCAGQAVAHAGDGHRGQRGFQPAGLARPPGRTPVETTFQTESFADVLEEARPLLARHWDEVAAKDVMGPLDVDEDLYRDMDRAGLLHIVTARRGGGLIGYAAFLMYRNHHYRRKLVAESDVFFSCRNAAGECLARVCCGPPRRRRGNAARTSLSRR